MDEKEKMRQELLGELARRFQSSAGSLKKIARRIDDAAREHHKTSKRIDNASSRLRDCIESRNEPVPFSYLEYLEFSSSEEFHKFKKEPIITDDEITTVDWEELSKKLLED